MAHVLNSKVYSQIPKNLKAETEAFIQLASDKLECDVTYSFEEDSDKTYRIHFEAREPPETHAESQRVSEKEARKKFINKLSRKRKDNTSHHRNGNELQNGKHSTGPTVPKDKKLSATVPNHPGTVTSRKPTTELSTQETRTPYPHIQKALQCAAEIPHQLLSGEALIEEPRSPHNTSSEDLVSYIL